MYGRPKDKGSYTDNAVLVYEGSEYGAGVLPERAVAIGIKAQLHAAGGKEFYIRRYSGLAFD